MHLQMARVNNQARSMVPRVFSALNAGLLICGLWLACVDQSVAQPAHNIERSTSFGFLQRSVVVPRAERQAVVDVEVIYVYHSSTPDNMYPDVREVISATLVFLQNLPDKRRYWELVARDGADLLLNAYPAFSSLTIRLTIHPDEQRSYVRTATATARRL